VEVFNRKLMKQMKVYQNTALIKLESNRDLFIKHGLHLNNRGKELPAKKIVSTIKYMVNKKTKEPTGMTWNEDHAKEILESHNSQEHQDLGFEKEINSLEKERRLTDIQEDIYLQTYRCQGLNDDVTTTVSSKRLQNPPIIRKLKKLN
jgi:hypothetical protein